MSKAKPSSADTNVLICPLRTLCGLTQEQFAAKLGVTVVTVNRWENYRAKPNASSPAPNSSFTIGNQRVLQRL